jgi:hypothetical protein
MYISICYVLTQSVVKNGYFSGLREKDNKHVTERLIILPNFVILRRPHKKSIFLKRLSVHVVEIYTQYFIWNILICLNM